LGWWVFYFELAEPFGKSCINAKLFPRTISQKHVQDLLLHADEQKPALMNTPSYADSLLLR